MIYLLSQMVLALAVAIVLGMALGWLIHRASHNRSAHLLKQTIAKQNTRLAQAQSEVAMLTDDYDEMQRQSQDQIIALREENRQIPSLNTNLEKSQLLVRQMMQRHEAKVRELTSERDRLTAKLSKVDAKEQAKNQAAAEIDKQQRDQKRSEDDAASRDKTASGPGATASALASGQAKSSGKTGADNDKEKPARFVAAESDEDPFDEVIEVADELQRELDLTAERKLTRTDDDTQQEPMSDLSQDATDADDLDMLIAIDDVADLTDPLEADERSSSERPDDSLDQADITHSLDDADGTLEQTRSTGRRASLLDVNSMTSAAEDNDEQAQPGAESSSDAASQNDVHLDGSGDESTLFDPVSQHDDLQQIFGIGPLTEKALNELGITSYSQLAELKQHEIQKIADALEIGPGRIERDNWVGNARQQLEDVLEQL